MDCVTIERKTILNSIHDKLDLLDELKEKVIILENVCNKNTEIMIKLFKMLEAPKKATIKSKVITST